jgi:hypothetical protein
VSSTELSFIISLYDGHWLIYDNFILFWKVVVVVVVVGNA